MGLTVASGHSSERLYGMLPQNTAKQQPAVPRVPHGGAGVPPAHISTPSRPPARAGHPGASGAVAGGNASGHPGTPEAEACRYCGAIGVPLLSPGSGPHACQASCQHCGRHLRWVSVLAPAERLARKTRARLAAMSKYPPTQAQLDYLKALGDRLSAPESMAEASERIDDLVQQRRGR